MSCTHLPSHEKVRIPLLFIASLAGSQALAQSPPKHSVLASRAHEIVKLGLNPYMKEEYETSLKSALSCICLYKKADMKTPWQADRQMAIAASAMYP